MNPAGPAQWVPAGRGGEALEQDTLQIWRVSSASAEDVLSRDLIGEDERHRAAGIADMLRRSQYLAGRMLLRELHIRHSAHLFTSLSHSGQWVVAAAARRGPVGVDVECIRYDRPIDHLSKRFFPPHEHAWLQQYAEDQRTLLFYALWTAKEALLKGLGMPPGAPHFAARPVLPPNATEDLPPVLAVEDCQVGWFQAAPGCAGAYAMPMDLASVRLLIPE